MIDNQLFEILNAQDWDTIYPALLRYADSKARKKLYWATKSLSDLPKGYSAVDITQRAICSVYDGVRKWEPEVVPDLLYFLKRTVDSLLSSLVKSYENKKRFVLEDEGQNEEGDVSLDSIDQFPETDNFGPLDILVEADLWKFLWEDAKDDPVRQSILLAFEEDDLKEPAEIAKKFDLTVEDVNKGKKRLRRSILRYRDNII